MTFLRFVFFMMMSVFLFGCNMATVEENQQFSLPADTIDTLSLYVEKGEVVIVGQEDRTEIEVVAFLKVVAETEEEALIFKQNNLAIQLAQEGNEAILTAEIDHAQQTVTEGAINFEIYVPVNLAISLKQTAGLLSIENIEQSIDINHGAGDIILHLVKGDVKLTDGAGNITITEAEGKLDIYNNAGLFTLDGLVGDLDIVAGSGAINIASVDGSISLISGTGSITVDNVTENVTVIQNRSGEVSITNVKGDVIQ